jgi:hypothetical protein
MVMVYDALREWVGAPARTAGKSAKAEIEDRSCEFEGQGIVITGVEMPRKKR